MSRLPSRRRPRPDSSGRPVSMFEPPTDYMNTFKQMGEGQLQAGNTMDISATATATSKQSKRRSLLPQFSTSRKVSEESAPIQEETPKSSISTRASSERQNDCDGDGDDRKAMPPPTFKPTRAASREGHVIPTRTSSHSHSHSHMRLPSIAHGSKTSVPTHTRTASRDGNANVIPTRTSSQQHAPASASASASSNNPASNGLKRTGSTRLPQSPGPRTSSQRAPGPSNGVPNGIPSTTAQKRSSMTIAKPPVLTTSVPAAPTQPTPTPSSPTRTTASVPSRTTTRSNLPPPSKPAFSTYQQHYSPVKSALPKPPIPTAKSLKPSNTPIEDESITFEVALEQVELLQLSLLHQEAGPAYTEYDTSAKQKLRKMHAKLQEEYSTIYEQEQEHRRQINLNALETWCPDAALLAEHLSSLSRVVSDLRGHTEPGSRYSQMVETFETWADRAESILMASQPAAAFIEALPESWRATHTSLALNMRSIQRDISMLPPLPPRNDAESASSLEVMIDDCVLLVDGMLKELEVMTKLQKEVLQRGKARIDEQISALVSAANDTRVLEKENWRPAWTSAG